MSIFDSIEKPKLGPQRLLVYGPHGVGKSTLASKAEDPIFIQTEDGLAGLNVDAFPRSGSFQDVKDALEALYTNDHKYKTIVIDSADYLERLIWHDVCESNQIETMEELGYGKAYAQALPRWELLLKGLDALRDKKGMSCVLIAHSRIERFQPPENDPYDRYCPKLHKLPSALLQEWCDSVFFAHYRVHTITEDGGFGQKKTKAISDGHRVLETTDRAMWIAKSRLQIAPTIPMEWEAYQSAIDLLTNSMKGVQK